VSDSAYVINCMTAKWFLGWRRKGWRTSSGDPVANRELWEKLIEVVERFPVPLIWTHVRGHGRGANDPAHHVAGNDIVDKLAGAARKAGSSELAQVAARRAALTRIREGRGKPASTRKRKVTMKLLEGVTFVTENGRYVALDIEDDGTVLLLEEGK
jgi:hypothetical protein